MASSEIQFTFDGKRLLARNGDTIASALYRNGIKVITRSVKFHRPRGLYCGTGDCPNCLVNVNGIPNVRACTIPVKHGMAVKSQNIILSRNMDPIIILDHLYKRGFDYQHRFIRPGFANGLYQRIIRRMAGIGEVPTVEVAAKSARRVRTDLLIIGGDPAAAVAAMICVSAGAGVIEIRPNQPPDSPQQRIEGNDEFASSSYLRIDNSKMMGAFDDGSIAAVSGERLHIVEPKFTLIAEAGRELPIVFPNWDLPGIMEETTCLALLRQNVPIGKRIILIGAPERAISLAGLLHDAGNEVIAILVKRPLPQEHDNWIEKIYMPGWRIAGASGRNQVSSAIITNGKEHEKIDCDCIITIGPISPRTEIARQLGCAIGDRKKSPPVILVGDGFETTKRGIFAIGISVGIDDPDRAIKSADIAAKNIVARMKEVGT